jgi:hypothetical protein
MVSLRQLMRMGVDPQTACNTAVAQIGKFYPQFSGNNPILGAKYSHSKVPLLL